MALLRVLASLGLLSLLSLTIATPAYADHNASVAPDGSWCYIGPYTSPVPIGLYTENRKKIKLKVYKDGSARYECTFKVPRFIPAAEGVYETDWYRLKKRAVTNNVYCWRPGEEESDNNTGRVRRFVLRPDGRATLTCETDANYYPPPAP